MTVLQIYERPVPLDRWAHQAIRLQQNGRYAVAADLILTI